MSSETRRSAEAWVQWAMVILAILAALVHVEGRLSTVEQHLADQDKQLERIEQRLDPPGSPYRGPGRPH